MRVLALVLSLAASLLCAPMAGAEQQTINVGSSANSGGGDPLRTAFSKTNANFTDLYAKVNGVASQSYVDATAQRLLDSLAGKAPVASPTFTGVVTLPSLAITGLGSTGDLSGILVTPANASTGQPLSALMAQRVVRGANDLTTSAYTGLPSFITFGNTDAKSYLYSYRTEDQRSLLGTHAIVRNTPGSGYFGPAYADFALLLGTRKNNWDTATGSAAKEGELDPLVIDAAQGKKGDLAGVLIDVVKRRDALSVNAADENGAVMGVEIAAKLIGADGREYHKFHVLPGFIEGPGGLSKGKGYGVLTLSKIGNAYAAFAASMQPVGGVDQFGNVAPANGWDNLIVNDATGAADGSGVNYRVNNIGRTFLGTPDKQVSHGYEPAADLYSFKAEDGSTIATMDRTTKVLTAAGGTRIGSGTKTVYRNAASATATIPTIGLASTVSLTTISLTGAKPGDMVSAEVISADDGVAGFRVSGVVAANDNIKVRVQNLTGAAYAGGATLAFTVKVERFQ